MSKFDFAKAHAEAVELFLNLDRDLEESLRRNPSTRFLGLTGLTGRPCLSCGAKADYFGNIPCGH